MSGKEHWNSVYTTKAPEAVSWYTPHLKTSLDLINQIAKNKLVEIIDVGGGESTLVDDLIKDGYQNISVLDISSAAINVARSRLGPIANGLHWYCVDVNEAKLPINTFDIWHDRAVFHFLTDKNQRKQYISQVGKSLKVGGSVVIATFSTDGPTECSGLKVMQYDSDRLSDEFGRGFQFVLSLKETHVTPSGANQEFIYCQFMRT